MTRYRPPRREKPLETCSGCGFLRPAVQMLTTAAGTLCRECVRKGRATDSGTPPTTGQRQSLGDDGPRNCRRCGKRRTMLIGGIGDNPSTIDYCESCDVPPEEAWI